MKSKINGIQLYVCILVALFILLALAHILGCVPDPPETADPSKMHRLSITKTQHDAIVAAIQAEQKPAMASMTPCDSIYYIPVAWGSELRVLKNTLSKGNRKGVSYWQAKTFAWQIIDPTRYQQDSTRERVVIADRDTITYSDTFYICRKIRL